MSPEKAFGFFHGIHLHFTTENYNVLKYGPNTQHAQARYRSMTAEQRYRFQWLSGKYQQTQDLVFACIASEFAELDIRYADKTDISDAYFKFKSRRESMTHTLESDFNKYDIQGQLPLNKLLFQYFTEQYSPEFILLLDSRENNLDLLYTHKTLSFARPKLLNLIKYRAFFNTSKYSDIINIKNEDIISA